MKSKIESFFSPEFVNRINNVVVFSDFSEDSLIKIINIQLKNLNLKLKSKKIKVFLDESCFSFFVKELEKINLGARPIERIFANEIESFLSKEILKKNISQKDQIKIFFDSKNKFFFKML